MPGIPCDDVIAIRVDTARAVADFLDQLRREAEAGETEAPAKPANRAIFRELAPYRLVEYDYVEQCVGPVEGAYVAFPDGSVYSCGEVIPEEAVDSLVAEGGDPLPPLWVYVLLSRPAPADAIRRYLDALADHLGMPVVTEQESGRRLGKDDVLAHHRSRTSLPDGRAFAHLSHRFSRRILEFASPAERDAFVAWSGRYCAATQVEGEAVLRPAEPCAVPPPTFRVIRVPPPPADAASSPQAYWAEVTTAIDRVMEQEQAEARRRHKG